MYPKRGTIIRPVLDCRRMELRTYLAELDITYVEDETNADVTIPRNRIRAELMPLLAASPRAHACYARHLAEFGLGRDIDARDKVLIDGLQRASALEGESIKELLMTVVASPQFMQRTVMEGAL